MRLTQESDADEEKGGHGRQPALSHRGARTTARCPGT